jgi:hypothetical protein
VNNSIVAARIQNAVNAQLMKKGMSENDQNPTYIVAREAAKEHDEH